MSSNEGIGKQSIADLVTNQVSAMLAYWDKDLTCRFANDAYLYWFGKTREEMVDKITMKELVGATLFKKNLPYISGALKGEAQTFEREILLPSGNETRYSLANYFPNIINGEVKGFFVHVADITSLKLLEKGLTESNETIREQNKRLLSFANIVTHNLKSYANNLGIILEMFINAASDGEKSEMLGFLKDISTGFSSTISHLSDIVETQNLSTIHLETVNLREFIQLAIDTLRIEVKANGTIIHNYVSRDITMMANPAYLDSIILNFLTNSIKYRHPDRSPVIDLNATITGQELILTIQDNGIGIDLTKHKNDLFGMYKTFHGNADAKGIGLFLVRSQVETLGGRIYVESEVGKGTTFKIHFAI